MDVGDVGMVWASSQRGTEEGGMWTWLERVGPPESKSSLKLHRRIIERLISLWLPALHWSRNERSNWSRVIIMVIYF